MLKTGFLATLIINANKYVLLLPYVNNIITDSTYTDLILMNLYIYTSLICGSASLIGEIFQSHAVILFLLYKEKNSVSD
jgi:tellurite resistance protein TehA-like permease